MKLEKIDDKARLWILTRGEDGKLHECTQFLSAIGAAATAAEIADIIAIAAGHLELAEARVW